MDEKLGVRLARQRGLAVTGTLGVLVQGARRGLVDIDEAIARLEATNFRCRPELFETPPARAREAVSLERADCYSTQGFMEGAALPGVDAHETTSGAASGGLCLCSRTEYLLLALRHGSGQHGRDVPRGGHNPHQHPNGFRPHHEDEPRGLFLVPRPDAFDLQLHHCRGGRIQALHPGGNHHQLGRVALPGGDPAAARRSLGKRDGEAEAAPVQLGSGERAGVLTGEEISSIALRGRDFMDAIGLLPRLRGKKRLV